MSLKTAFDRNEVKKKKVLYLFFFSPTLSLLLVQYLHPRAVKFPQKLHIQSFVFVCFLLLFESSKDPEPVGIRDNHFTFMSSAPSEMLDTK